MRKIFLFLCFSVPTLWAQSQDKLNVKFGKITASDFNVSSPVIDSGSNAVVLSDIGNASFEGNTKGWFTLVFTRHKRVKILNKQGMDAATVEIPLFQSRSSGSGEQLDNVKAATYSLENGAIAVTKLESNNLFTEQTNKYVVTKKFTFPAVKEGSIIEYTYTTRSDFFFNLQPWTFQGNYPCLWSEYEVNIPEFFEYVFLGQGYLNFDVSQNSNSISTFFLSFSNGASASQFVRIPGGVATKRWVVKNAPALKEEPFTSTLKNHVSKIEFQLSQYRFPEQPPKPVMGDWKAMSKEMLESESFGLPIKRGNGWLDDDLAGITAGASGKEEKARKIFAYIRDNFTSTTFGTGISGNGSLKDIVKKKNGSVAELNLLLIAMLRHEKIDAVPILLSTRGNGFAHPIYPLMDRYNYIVCLATIDSTEYLLDASKPRLAFGKLPAYCYNGVARVIDTLPEAVELSADKLSESKLTNVFIINKEKGGMEGTLTSTLGYYESLGLRDKLAQGSQADYFKDIAKIYPAEIRTENYSIDSLKQYDEPVAVKYDLNFDFNGEETIYFNPMLGELVKENTFKSLKRQYPVEMPYTLNNTYLLNMDIPRGYVVDELPKSARVELENKEGMFEYLVSKTEDKIQFRCRLVLRKANFANEEYDVLRQFFGYMVKKESEQIVFKKIK